jgi:predicted HicB family RNase H-like nuclease
MKATTFEEYRGYTPLIWHSVEDDSFVGLVAGLYSHIISFEGDTEDAVRKDFESAIDFYLDTTENPEKPYGRIVLNIPPALHAELCRKAQHAEKNLNDWLISKLEEMVLHA